MKRSSIVLLTILILAACSGGRHNAPSRLDNACAIKAQRASWFKALRKTERRWGIPPHVILATLYQESKFEARARTPLVFKMGIIPWGRRSSAYGYSQAIDNTWDWYRRDTRRLSAKRYKFKDAVDFMGWYMNETFERNGVSKTDAYNQYLAYHDGHSGFARKSYLRKRWLPPVARKVAARAAVYKEQLRNCPRR